ncbi:GAF domain-containing protein [Tardiphaga alba]|uniref:GAF domain-containing protein n=1 Tax=Tardiphaga alba TaxID=340268 RepID=A0ABX8A6B8_9BRAD|nr:histidine kinase dimerization/phosphoacceptor domain -containing protein [Tardiphaga alba]QUS38043.1 GAF domain-containing protein [Tardiphaga alba]
MWVERDRIAALHRFKIFDSAHDADFSDFVQLASDICNAPVAAINMIDESKHWTLSGIQCGDRELPLSHSICAQAILQNDVFIVPDLTCDRRFRDNPLVAGEPHLRFYAGTLLKTSESLPIGTLCVLDYSPRPAGLSDRQSFALEALARQTMTQLELRRTTMNYRDGEIAREKLELALKEKGSLVKEIHHRVKNNLQLISSLLSIQGARIADPTVSAILADSRNRVRSMALIHENLYLAGNLANVSMRSHLPSLCSHLRRAYANSKIELTTYCDDVKLDLDAAIACGLILNELVSNAFKHGFSEDLGGEGCIKVELKLLQSDECVLLVSDNGRNRLPADDLKRSESLGLELVRDLVEQLHGTFTVSTDSGTVCAVSFPCKKRFA